MAFWGIEIKPGEPYVHQYDDEKGRLHLSQATLGSGKSKEKAVVVCNVGDKKPIYLCSLLPRKMETCSLNIEFEEYDGVTFSVEGSHNIHLSGFFYGNEPDSDGDDYEFSSDEDDSGEDSDFDDEDDLTDDEVDMFPSSNLPNGGVRIEEIVDDEKPDESAVSEQAKKKNKQASNNADDIPSKKGEKGKAKRKNEVDDSENKAKRKKDDSVEVPTPESDVKKSKKKNKKAKDTREDANVNNEVQKEETNKKQTPEKAASLVKDKKNKQQENNTLAAKVNGSATEANSSQVRTFPNGLVIEKIKKVKPNEKRANSGKKISVHYIGKLKKNGKIFDSNIGKAPFRFRLGAGEVIAGWDVGIKGMCVGEKRRLTIPPSMGYGAGGAGSAIPPNSWLVFDVELVNVN